MVFLLASSLLTSCSKEEIESQNRGPSLIEIRSHLDQTYTYLDETTDVLTELGELKQNPYSIENLMLAMISLCGDTIGSNIRATDKQIKFSPRSFDEAVQLFADSSLILLEYNINREVIKRGTYLHEYNEGDEIPDFYSVIPVEQALDNNIPFEVLEIYSFIVDNPILLAESFRLTGNTNLIHDYIEFSEITMNSLSICNLFPPPPTEDCSCGNLILYPQTISENEIIYAWKCPCNDPAIPNCKEPCYLEFQGTNWEATPPAEVWKCICPMQPGNEGIASINNCGCPTYGSETRPAGCVNVENTRTNLFEGVERVKVTVEKFLCSPESTYTDNNGCWRINKSYKGNISVHLNFQNENNYIRKSSFSIRSIKDPVGSSSGPDYRHFETNYGLWDEIGSTAQRYWGAATVNNELNDFSGMTNDLATIPTNLDIVLVPDSEVGSAPMDSYLFGEFAPDLYIGTNQGGTIDMQDLLFHELAHASHYTQNGPGWWNLVVAKELDNLSEFNITVIDFWQGNILFELGDPWGDGADPSDEIVGLAESWAEFVSNDLLFPDNFNENRTFWGGQGGWVPIGLYHDLIDGGTEPPFTTITDNIQGYTREEVFNQINSSTFFWDQYQTNLLDILPPGNTEADLELLLMDYNLQ